MPISVGRRARMFLAVALVIAGLAAPEPLLPVEKKLIGFSLGTGLVLLIALALLNYFMPATF